MDNKQIPEQEENSLLPEEITEPVTAAQEVPAEAAEEYYEEAPMAEPEDEDAKVSDAELPQHPADAPSQEELAEPVHKQPFDLSVLDDPELDASEEAPVPEEIPAPQETVFRDQEFHEAFGDGEEFDEIFNAPAEEKAIPFHDRPVRKGRPRRKKGELFFGLPQLAVTAVWLAIIVIIGVTLGRMLWVSAADVLAFGREPKQVTITIYESDTMDDIIQKLHDAELVRYPGLFKLYADLAVDEGEIRPGIWDLNTVYDYHALVSMMSPSSNREEVEVLIPEGFTCRQIFALLEENKVCTAVDIANYAASGELDEYWFLEDVQRGDEYCLEGFLFPDTYKFYKNDTPRSVLQKMLNNFDNRFTEEMRAQIDTLNAKVTEGTFSIRDVVIVASMIEKETASNDESATIASVIYNRLFNWGGTPAYLNIDASIVYALDGKTDLTREDLQIDHPYNTYTNVGLTPGAIANPGLASLKAALSPADTDYYFYVLNPAAGKHKFSKTLDEHNTFIANME